MSFSGNWSPILKVAQLINKLACQATDANDLVASMLQSGLQAGLQAEMHTHLGY